MLTECKYFASRFAGHYFTKRFKKIDVKAKLLEERRRDAHLPFWDRQAHR